jgi:hypothetical protein
MGTTSCAVAPAKAANTSSYAGEPLQIAVVSQAKNAAGEYETRTVGQEKQSVFVALSDDDPRSLAAREAMLALPTLVRELRLLQATKRYMAASPPPRGFDARSWKAGLDSPLFFSVDGMHEEMSWFGFTLRSSLGDQPRPATPFVELNATEQQLRSGAIDSSLLHEVGHQFMYTALGGTILPCGSPPGQNHHPTRRSIPHSIRPESGWLEERAIHPDQLVFDEGNGAS